MQRREITQGKLAWMSILVYIQRWSEPGPKHVYACVVESAFMEVSYYCSCSIRYTKVTALYGNNCFLYRKLTQTHAVHDRAVSEV